MDLKSLQAQGWDSVSTSGFTGQIGPFLTLGNGVDRKVGLIIEERHCNSHMGTAHGGVLMSFSDVSLGLGVVDALGGPYCATSQLHIQFVSTAKIGELIVCSPEIVRKGKDLVFMRGLIRVGDRNIANVDGIWKVLSPKPGKP